MPTTTSDLSGTFNRSIDMQYQVVTTLTNEPVQAVCQVVPQDMAEILQDCSSQHDIEDRSAEALAARSPQDAHWTW